MDIPSYPQSRAITLEDKPLLDRFFQELQPRISELTFANLYLFRVPHDYRLTTVADSVVALGRGYDGSSYFLPPFSGDIAVAAAELLDTGATLYGADYAFLERYLWGGGYEVLEDRDNFDYLHLKEEMATLKGKEYHKKKNRVNYFMVRHRHEVDFYDGRHVEGALALLDEWRRVRAAAVGPVTTEVDGTAEALKLYDRLGLSGIVILVEGKVKGFALGERLNETTAVCHFEKGDLFMDGLYQLLDREFARLIFPDCQYLNREQDLGEPSLRQAKLSYHPLELVKKYRVRRKSG